MPQREKSLHHTLPFRESFKLIPIIGFFESKMSGPGKIFSLALESEFSVPHSYLDPPQFSAIYSCLSLLLVLLSLVSVLLFLMQVSQCFSVLEL